MTNAQPDMATIVNQMILAVVDGRIDELKLHLKKDILVENKPFLTVSDFSELTGLKKSTILKYCSIGKISFFRPTSKQTYFTWQNIQDFVLDKKCYNPAKSEIRRKVQSEYILKKI